MPLVIGVKCSKAEAGIIAASVRDLINGVTRDVVEPEYDHVLSFGEIVMKTVWDMSPILCKYDYYDPALKRFNIDMKTLTLTLDKPTATSNSHIEDIKCGILSVNEYVRYFGRRVIPDAFGNQFWIKNIENNESSGWKLCWDYKYDEEIEYINERGFFVEEDSIEKYIEIISSAVINKIFCPLNGEELLEFIIP